MRPSFFKEGVDWIVFCYGVGIGVGIMSDGGHEIIAVDAIGTMSRHVIVGGARGTDGVGALGSVEGI